MPFRQRCRITLENIGFEEVVIFYQINYALNEVAEDAAYFHAQFRRVNPLPYGKVYTLLDGVKGKGHYVGTYMAWSLQWPSMAGIVIPPSVEQARKITFVARMIL